MRGSIHSAAQKMLDCLKLEKDLDHAAPQSLIVLVMICARQELRETAEREWHVEKAAMKVEHDKKVQDSECQRLSFYDGAVQSAVR